MNAFNKIKEEDIEDVLIDYLERDKQSFVDYYSDELYNEITDNKDECFGNNDFANCDVHNDYDLEENMQWRGDIHICEQCITDGYGQ